MKHSENIKDLTLSQIIKLKSEKNIPDYAQIVLDSSDCYYEGDNPEIVIEWHTYEDGSFLENNDNIRFYMNNKTYQEYGTIQINKYNVCNIIPSSKIFFYFNSVSEIYKIN
jgi:hypothetical protein